MARVRVRYAKVGKVRWTSHRDLARMWERAFRRVGLPLAYTSGFSPRPRVSFGLALPTGHESVAEYLDLDTTDETLDTAALPGRLSAALPVGVDATAAAWLAPGAPSLQADVGRCGWEWTVLDAEEAPLHAGALADAAAALIDAGTAVITRRRKDGELVEDIRPLIASLEVVPASAPARLRAVLACQPRGPRPGEVLAALDPTFEVGTARRTHQWVWRHGAWEEPLGAPGVTPGATGAPHATERAS